MPKDLILYLQDKLELSKKFDEDTSHILNSYLEEAIEKLKDYERLEKALEISMRDSKYNYSKEDLLRLAEKELFIDLISEKESEKK